MKPELESLTNRFWQLQRLLEEGHYVAPELENTWEEMVELIHRDDQEKITDLRERIRDIIKEEVIQKAPEDISCKPPGKV